MIINFYSKFVRFCGLKKRIKKIYFTWYKSKNHLFSGNKIKIYSAKLRYSFLARSFGLAASRRRVRSDSSSRADREQPVCKRIRFRLERTRDHGQRVDERDGHRQIRRPPSQRRRQQAKFDIDKRQGRVVSSRRHERTWDGDAASRVSGCVRQVLSVSAHQRWHSLLSHRVLDRFSQSNHYCQRRPLSGGPTSRIVNHLCRFVYFVSKLFFLHYLNILNIFNTLFI